MIVFANIGRWLPIYLKYVIPYGIWYDTHKNLYQISSEVLLLVKKNTQPYYLFYILVVWSRIIFYTLDKESTSKVVSPNSNFKNTSFILKFKAISQIVNRMACWMDWTFIWQFSLTLCKLRVWVTHVHDHIG